MPPRKHRMLGLSPFIVTGCNKAAHSMHEKVSFHIDNNEFYMLASIIRISLDYAKLEFIPPSTFNGNNQQKEEIIPESHKMRMSEFTFKNVSAMHERCLQLSF